MTVAEARAANPKWDITRSWALPDVPVREDDESFADYLRRIGFDDESLGYANRAWINASGESGDRLSAAVSLQVLWLKPTFSDPFYGSPVPSAGKGDYRISEGYNALHDGLAEGLDIRLNTVARSVDWSDSPVRVTADDGQVFTADRVLITLPLAVLKANKVQFTPALPEWKQAAIDRLQMAPAFKLVYKFAQLIMPRGITALYSAGEPPMWWTPQPHAEGEQVWIALATGDWARDLLALGEDGAIARGLETLRGELGQPELTPVEARIINWTDDELALGGYSTVPVGGNGLREVLARPAAGDHGEVLFFAGEATAPNPYASTVHGAYVTGRRAASEILSAL
ncbi:MAG: FAD-dependent oxidoreductase [Anaerolineae bacterium]|nr:FAD-dependent oxidoreductase [Anaerolineae bacterium]